jgi:hypothetical protein
MTPSLVDDAAIRFLRDEARVVLAAPHEIHQIRRALVAATGIAGTR